MQARAVASHQCLVRDVGGSAHTCRAFDVRHPLPPPAQRPLHCCGPRHIHAITQHDPVARRTRRIGQPRQCTADAPVLHDVHSQLQYASLCGHRQLVRFRIDIASAHSPADLPVTMMTDSSGRLPRSFHMATEARSFMPTEKTEQLTREAQNSSW